MLTGCGKTRGGRSAEKVSRHAQHAGSVVHEKIGVLRLSGSAFAHRCSGICYRMLRMAALSVAKSGAWRLLQYRYPLQVVWFVTTP